MKKVFAFFSMLLSLFFLASCEKDQPVKNDWNSFVSEYQNKVEATANQFADGPEGSLIFSESEFQAICRAEDSLLNIWSDEDLRYCMPVGHPNHLSYAEKLSYLRSKIAGRTVEDQTIETYFIRWNKPPFFDATPDIVAQVIAASGTTVGVNSSLNYWKPINDTGNIVYNDILRAMAGVNQTTSMDTYLEYVPESVVFETQVSGGNWLIAVDIVVTDFAGQTSTVHYGMDSPNGPLIWNSTLSSPADDDRIEGPLPGGYIQMIANGLTPPAPLD